MKKFYTFALCLAACLPASADGLRFKSVRGHREQKKALAAEAQAPVWRPASQTDYIHDGDDWMEIGSVAFKYDNRGNCTEELVDEDGFMSRKVTVYNEFNFPLTILDSESEDGLDWTNSGKTTYTYDSRIHGFHTERYSYDWSDGMWVQNYKCETNTITRDDNGNIVELVKSLPLDSEIKPAYKSIWNYGTDGKANEYFYYYMGRDNEWQLYDNLSYKDIVWEKTDGQMTVYGDLLELTEGDNLLKSAVVYYNGQPDGHYLVEYAGTAGGFLIKETTNDISEVGRTTRMEILDANGSVRLTTTEYFDEDGNILAEPVYTDIQEAIMDSHGNMVEYNAKEIVDGVEETVASTRYTYTYDANGNITEKVSDEYDYDSQEYYPSERTAFGEYINAAAGVDDIRADGYQTDWTITAEAVTATAPGLTGLSVYNLQGACVARVASATSATVSTAALAPGIYIIRADGTSAARRYFRN